MAANLLQIQVHILENTNGGSNPFIDENIKDDG